MSEHESASKDGQADGRGPNAIRLGDIVIVDCGEKVQFITVRPPKSMLKLGNSFCSVEPLVGAPYGSIFTLAADGKSLERTTHTVPSDWDDPSQLTNDVAENNSKLVDEGSNQQLSHADIQAMKAAGAGGEAIVAALTSNSSTFEGKTKFSQEKYKKKKAKKYIQLAVVRRPTAASVCEAYFLKQPARIGFLRIDTLSTLLSLANVGAHARALVMDGCGGMVTAAVTERLGGYGSVVRTYVGGKAPPAEALRQFNFSAAEQVSVRSAPLAELLAAAQPPAEGPAEPAAAATDAPAPAAEDGAAAPVDAPAQEDSTAAAVEAAPGGDADAATPAPQPAGPPFNSCILAVPGSSPTALIRAVLPLLAPSTPFAIYGRWLQPLAECMDALRHGQQAVNLALHESWLREQQVLPSRTHPTMNMNHGGGYVLSGTTVAPAAASAAADGAPPAAKKART